jgi:putative transposase
MNFTLPEDFKPFDWRGDFWNYERNLPHWRQPGVTYFITFRLNDSLPAEVVEQAKRERDEWERRILEHRNLLPESLQEDYIAWQRRTWRKMEAVMDECHGSCILRQPDIRQIVADALLFFEGQRSSMHSFVIMPNHVHLAVVALGDYQIEDVIKSWKGYTARVINEKQQRKGQMWQEDSWNRIIRDDKHWLKVMRYIANNPSKAHLLEGEFTAWFAKRTDVERVFQPVLREAPPTSPYPEDEPW